jgi:hypothetical protein
MKADRIDSLAQGTGARLPCREHPVLCLSLFAFMFVPAVADEVALGRWLTESMPHPGLIAMQCFAPVMVILFIIGMLIGATIWLLLMKRFVQRTYWPHFFSAVHASRYSLVFARRYLPGVTVRTDRKPNRLITDHLTSSLRQGYGLAAHV